MTPIQITQIVILIIWLISFLMVRAARSINDEVNANFFLSLELTTVGFMWIFIGFNHGWW